MKHLKKFEGVFDEFMHEEYPYSVVRYGQNFSFIGTISIPYNGLINLLGEPKQTDEHYNPVSDDWYKNPKQRLAWDIVFEDGLACEIFKDWYNLDNVNSGWKFWNVGMNFLHWKGRKDRDKTNQPIEPIAKEEILTRLQNILNISKNNFINADDIADNGTRRVSESMFDGLIDEQEIEIKVVREMYSTGKIATLDNISYDELQSVLGEPIIFETEDGEVDKTQITWSMQLDDYIPCSIYDYKTGVLYQENDVWSIGGVFDKHTDIILNTFKAKFPNAEILTEEERMEKMLKLYRERE